MFTKKLLIEETSAVVVNQNGLSSDSASKLIEPSIELRSKYWGSNSRVYNNIGNKTEGIAINRWSRNKKQ